MRQGAALLVTAAAGTFGCAGYNLQFGTTDSNLAGFHQVYEVPATSLLPWTERRSALSLPPPPDGGASGVSTLPANPGALPPERPGGSSPN